MTELEIAASYAEIIGAAAVLIAIAFAVIEFRQLKHQRLEAASLEMIRSWQGPDYVNALYAVLQLEDHISPDALGESGEDHLQKAFRVCVTYEALGIMAHRGTLPIKIVNELMGGVVSISWRKLDLWVYQMRLDTTPRFSEWFEWLARQVTDEPVVRPPDS